MERLYMCGALMPGFCGHGQVVAPPPVDAMGGACGPPGKQGGLGVATGEAPPHPPLGPMNGWRNDSSSTAVASDTDDSDWDDRMF